MTRLYIVARLFYFYAQYTLCNAGLAISKSAGKNVNNLNMQMTPPLWQKVKSN